MRDFHGNLPRNPFNMIIQENHAVTKRYTFIIPYHAPTIK